MEFLRAFTYMFSDQRWLIKLAETALLVALCPVPVIGLLCLCALLGYLAEIVHNVSSDYPRPLPEWDHIGEDISKGAHVLLAIALYHLPPMMVIGLLYVLRESLAVSLFGSITFTGVLAAIMPFLLIYLVLAWALLAIGLANYAESWDSSAFYQFNRLLRSLGNHGALTSQWLVYSLAASIILLALLPIAPVLFFPAQGYLTGNFGRRLRAARMALRDSHAAAEPVAAVNGFGFAAPEAPAPLQRK
ncbi:MAG: DUF4013 domain-containing protein [Chloroflexi bacterium]|nr:DUF4013 domain-containing protein [Chloroflexota bacterium]